MKTFSQLIESLKGTYVGVRFDKESIKTIKEIQSLFKIPNPTPENDLHSTVVFSRNEIDFPIKTGIYEPIDPVVKFHVFKTQSGKRALVLKIDSEYLKQRHELANQLGATYDFPDYIPHITLSYDIGEKNYSMKPFNLEKSLVICDEYSEELDLEWKSKS